MNSDRLLRLAFAGTVSLATLACADFRRGDYWDDPEETTGASGAATSSAPGDDDSGPADGGDDGNLDDSGGSEGSDSGGAPAVSFAAEVHPLLIAGCERCHSADGQANTTSLIYVDDPVLDLEGTLDFVDLDSPPSSRLLSKTTGQGHTGGVIYDDDSNAYTTILAWIEQGAHP
jgi:hypothetical protein